MAPVFERAGADGMVGGMTDEKPVELSELGALLEILKVRAIINRYCPSEGRWITGRWRWCWRSID